jgi:hypothetical protein
MKNAKAADGKRVLDAHQLLSKAAYRLPLLSGELSPTCAAGVGWKASEQI